MLAPRRRRWTNIKTLLALQNIITPDHVDIADTCLTKYCIYIITYASKLLQSSQCNLIIEEGPQRNTSWIN